MSVFVLNFGVFGLFLLVKNSRLQHWRCYWTDLNNNTSIVFCMMTFASLILLFPGLFLLWNNPHAAKNAFLTQIFCLVSSQNILKFLNQEWSSIPGVRQHLSRVARASINSETLPWRFMNTSFQIFSHPLGGNLTPADSRWLPLTVRMV